MIQRGKLLKFLWYLDIIIDNFNYCKIASVVGELLSPFFQILYFAGSHFACRFLFWKSAGMNTNSKNESFSVLYNNRCPSINLFAVYIMSKHLIVYFNYFSLNAYLLIVIFKIKFNYSKLITNNFCIVLLYQVVANIDIPFSQYRLV